MTNAERAHITASSQALTLAQQAARAVRNEDDAMDWLHQHYYPGIENDALHDELTAMHADIVSRVYGTGGG